MKGKMKIDDDKKAALSSYVEDWLRGQGLITGEQVIEISLRVLPSTPRVLVTSVEDGKSLKDVLGNVPRNRRVRIENALEYVKISHLDELLCLSIDKLLKWRNIGNTTILALGEALEKSGLGESHLAQDIKRYYAQDRLTLKIQSDRSLVKPLNNSDWNAMLISIQKVVRKHTKMQVEVITALRKANNVPTNVSELFRKGTDPSWWVSYIHLINLRWESSKLPYRMKFTRTPTPQCKWEGKVQIGLYQE